MDAQGTGLEPAILQAQWIDSLKRALCRGSAVRRLYNDLSQTLGVIGVPESPHFQESAMKNPFVSMPASQYGFSKFGLLMMLIVLVSGLTFGLKILPVYLDHNFVKGVAEELIADGRAANLTQNEIRDEIASGLRVNNVRDFNLNSVSLERENAQPVLIIEYERRVPLVANIDVIISFDDRIE